MFDPAAMGTLLIGLNAERAEAQGHRRRRAAHRSRTTRPSVRVTLAAMLRRAAAILEPRVVGEAAPEAR